MASYEYKVKIGAESDIAKVVNADLKKAMSDAKSNKIKLEFDVASMEQAIETMKFLQTNNLGNKVSIDLDTQNFKDNLDALNAMSGKSATDIASQFKQNMEKAFSGTADKSLYDLLDKNFNADSLTRRIEDLKGQISSYKFDETDFVGMQSQAQRYLELIDLVKKAQTEIASGNLTGMTQEQLGQLVDVGKYEAQYESFTQSIGKLLAETEKFGKVKQNLEALKIEGDKASDYQKLGSAVNEYAESLNKVEKANKVAVKGKDSSAQSQMLAELQNTITAYKNVQTIMSQMRITYGEQTANSMISSLNIGKIDQSGINNIVGQYTASIDAFLNKLKGNGDITNGMRASLESLRAEVSQLDSSFASANGMEAWLNKISSFSQKFTAQMKGLDTFQNSFGKLDQQLSKMGSFAQTEGKISKYSETVQGLKQELNNTFQGMMDGSMSPEKVVSSLDSIRERMEALKKTANSYNSVRGGKNLIESTIGKVQDLGDVEAYLRQYAEVQKLGTEIGKTVNTGKNNVTMTFQADTGEITKLSADMVQVGSAANNGAQGIAMMSSAMSGANASASGLSSTMSEVGNALAMYFSTWKLVSSAINEFKQGFNTFKELDSALTNISYTMNVSKDQLKQFGESAVNMAKDLSMSVKDTEDIYKIYANMNTSMSEIEQTAKPTAILANLSGEDASTAADQIQGIIQQFGLLDEAGANAADVSMHVVDAMNDISANVAMDYGRGISVIADAVQAAGAVASDAGMSFEQLAAISAKSAERTRESGSTVGNAIKTITTRLTKVGKMPAYADEVSNEELSKASESLAQIGIQVYNADGSFREMDTVLGELAGKWDGLTDAQQANIAFNIAATRQTSQFRNILMAWTESMDLAAKATNAQGSAEANQQKYQESVAGQMQQIATQWDAFWLKVFQSDGVNVVLDFILNIVKGLNTLADTLGGTTTAFLTFMAALKGMGAIRDVILGLFAGKGLLGGGAGGGLLGGLVGGASKGDSKGGILGMFLSPLMYGARGAKSLISKASKGLSGIMNVVATEAAGATEAQHLLASGIITADELETAGYTMASPMMQGLSAGVSAIAPVAIPAAILAGIGGVAAYAAYKDGEYDRNVEAFNESSQKFATDTSDLDSLKGKLSEVNSQIEQINSQGTLTLTDEVQLRNLMQQSKELERQIALKEQQQKIDEAKAKEDAQDLVKSDVKNYGTGQQQYMVGSGFKDVNPKTNVVDATESNLKVLEEYNKKIRDSNDEYDELMQKQANGVLSDAEETQLKELQTMRDEANEINAQVAEDMANLSSAKPFLDAATQARINAMEIQYAAKDATSSTEADLLKLQAKFEDGTNTSMQRIKDYVLETASSGEEAVSMMEQLGISMESLGLVDSSNASRYFQDMIDSAKQAKESVDEVKEAVGNTFDAVKSASESANQGANWDEMGGFLKNAKDLFEKGLVGTDDFQTAAAFISPKNIDPSQFKYASDAYVKAWKESYEKAQRYLDAENPHDSMDNFINDLVGKGAASRKGDDEILFNFDKTSEAAKELNTSVGVVEASLRKLEEYGFELDGIEFSGEQLSQYSENLEGLKALYESMETSSTKDLLGKKIEGFETEYGKYQEDLSKLSEEQIVKIKFEYDLASLQMEVENAVRDAASKGTTESWASATTAQLRERAFLEKNNKYKEDEDNSYQAVSKHIQDNMAKMQKETDEGKRKIIAQNNAMLTEMQNSFLEYNADGGKLDFSQWFQSDQALKTLDDLSSQYNLTTDELRNMIATAFGEQYNLAESADKAIRDSRKSFGELQRDYKNSKEGLEKAEKSSKYDEGAKDYSFATSQRRDLRNRAKEARDNKDWAGAEYYQRQVNGIQQLQTKFQELQNNGADISWTDFLKADEYQSAINDILKETGMGRDQLEKILGVDLPPVTLEVASDTPDKIKEQLEELQDSGEEATITLDAQMSDGSLATIEATLDENGVVHYTANVDGVESVVVPVLHQDGTITYEANLPPEVQNLKEGESTTFKAKIDVDGEEVEKEITALNENGTVKLTAEINNKEEILNMEGGQIHYTSVVDQKGDKTPEKPKDQESKQTIKGDASGAKKAAQEATSAIKSIPDSHNTTITASAGNAVSTAKGVASAIDSIPTTKNVNIHVKQTGVNPGSVANKIGKYTGTAYRGGGGDFRRDIKSAGSAYASGTVDDNNFPTTWKTQSAGTALVGELGREIVVDTNNSRWYTVGDSGAEFAKIPKNAIIFNNDQTEELLSNGSLNGASYASGTAYAGGRWPGSSSSSSKSSSSKSSKKSSSRSKSSSSSKSSKSSKSSEDKTAKKSKLTEYLQNIFDWAEYRLKNLATITDRYTKLADNSQVWSKEVTKATKKIEGVNVQFTKGGAAQLYNKAIQAINKQLAGSQKALNGYQSFYKSVVQKSGLDKATIKKIQNLTASGQFNVEAFKAPKSSGKKGSSSSKNEKLQNIENVSKWYQKVLETQSSIEDLMAQRAELAQKKLDAIEDIYGAKLSVYENTMKRDQAKMEYILNTSGTTSKYFNAGKSVVKSGKQTIDASEEEYKIFERQFNKQVKNGTLKKGTKAYNTNLAKLRELESKIYEASLDLQEQIAKTFENIADHFEELRDRNDEKLEVNEGNIDIAKRNQAGYTSNQLRNLYNERNNLQYNNMQLAAQELAAQRANKNALISSNPKDVTAIKAADKAIEEANNKYAQAVTDYKQYLYEHREELIENIENYYDSLEDYFSSIQDAVDTQIDLKRTQGKVVTVGDYNSSVKAAEEAAKITQQRFEAVYNEFKDQIEKGYLTIGSEKYYQALAKVNSLQNDMVKAEQSRLEVYNQISQLKIDNIQNVIDGFENLNDTLSNFADLLNDMGNKKYTLGKVDESYLRTQMGISEQTIYGYDAQKTEILKQMEGVEKYSDRWNELNGKLQDANSNIIKAAQSMEEFADAIREVRWDKFNKGIEAIDYTKTELSDLVDILNEDNFIAKNGAFTAEGLSAIALQGQAIKQNVEEVEAHRVALRKLKEEYDNNVISLDEYTDQSREHMDAIRDGVSAYQDLRDSMIDKYFDALEKENELLQENIDKRRDALDRELICGFPFNCWNALRAS